MIKDVHIAIGGQGSSGSYEMPYRSYYFKNMVQFILTKEELLNFGIKQGEKIQAISLKSTGQPSRNLSNFKISAGQTESVLLSAWESNLTLVWSGTVNRTDLIANTYKQYEFIQPYEIGEGNLVIEVSRYESTGANNGSMGTRTGLASGKMIGWRADNGSFPSGTSGVTKFDYILDISLAVEPNNYKPIGTHTTTLIPIDEPAVVSWLEDKPIETDIVIEYATQENPTHWMSLINGQTIDVVNGLYLKATLTTADPATTPKLQDLRLGRAFPPQDKILITLEDLKRFNNVEGNLTVTYDESKGTLAGEGGPVAGFIESFTPIGLEPKPNPNGEESFIVTASTLVNFIVVYYRQRYASEKFTVTPRCAIDFIFVGVINP